MVRGFSRFALFLFLGLLRAPTRNSPERVRDTIWTFPKKSGKRPGLETPRFSFSQVQEGLEGGGWRLTRPKIQQKLIPGIVFPFSQGPGWHRKKSTEKRSESLAWEGSPRAKPPLPANPFSKPLKELRQLGCRKWGCNKWGLKGCLAALPGNRPKSAKMALFLPFSPFSGGCQEHLKNPENGGKRPFSSDFLGFP